ncbi:hypothetical protein ACFLQR_02010 [Verrucomicrobiota bacterium]
MSRFIIGGNPFSGFSHQSIEKDLEMKRYFTTDRIKQTLKQAEGLGITTHMSRTDHHILRVLMEYRDQGGKIQWFAQTCPEVGNHETCVSRAAEGGAKACHIHGGLMDFLFAQHKLDEIPPVVRMIKDRAMLAGIAAHNPEVIRWAEDNLDVDFYMCCYYNPASRDEQAAHVSGMEEWFRTEDRDAMVKLIKTLSKPAIHYKVLAAGRNDPEQAFAFVAKHLRPQDAVCVGVFPKDNPGMLEQDLKLFETSLRKVSG